MTKPMTIDAVKKAERLIRERERIAKAEFKELKGAFDIRVSGAMHLGGGELSLPFDEELAWAVEQFRTRRIEAINAQLRELGVDLAAPEGERGA